MYRSFRFCITLTIVLSTILSGCKKEITIEKFNIPLGSLKLKLNSDDEPILEIIYDSVGIVNYQQDTTKIVEIYVQELSERGLRERRCYYLSGNLMMVEKFNKKGQKDGLQSTYYDEEHCLNVRGLYFNGKESGQWLFHYPNCRKQLSVGYVEGAHTGMDTFWREDGTIDLVLPFFDNVPIDTGLIFDQHGKLEYYLLFENGQVRDSVLIRQ